MSLKVMVNGAPGNMGIEVAQAVLDRGLELIPWSLTGEAVEQESVEIGGVQVALLKPSDRDEKIKEIKVEFGEFITVDYTHPSAVNSNAEFYVANELPFVMGTTGGDREKLAADVENAGLYSVIAPNMAKQIVAFQAMMEYVAENFPGVFSGWKLHVEESHQKTKADTSGTAKAVVASMQKMGLKYSVEDIELIREEQEQVQWMGVPPDALTGHAFHTYNIDSSDDSVHFEFQHNVCGRRIYAEGTVDAVQFLAKQIESDSAQKNFNMIDVLKSGGMQ